MLWGLMSSDVGLTYLGQQKVKYGQNDVSPASIFLIMPPGHVRVTQRVTYEHRCALDNLRLRDTNGNASA